MSGTFGAHNTFDFTGMLPILTPRSSPYLIYQYFLHYIPSASLIEPNILSNNDTISILCYTLSTNPESSHAWIVFRFLQEDAFKSNAGVDTSTTYHSTFFAFPPSPLFADISKIVIELWKSLQPYEVLEWAELARDIRIAHAQLVAVFGNGVVFDGKDWEEQRYYHARTLYFKWMGLQAISGTTGTSDTALGYGLHNSTQWEISPQTYGGSSHGMVDPYLTAFNGQVT